MYVRGQLQRTSILHIVSYIDTYLTQIRKYIVFFQLSCSPKCTPRPTPKSFQYNLQKYFTPYNTVGVCLPRTCVKSAAITYIASANIPSKVVSSGVRKIPHPSPEELVCKEREKTGDTESRQTRIQILKEVGFCFDFSTLAAVTFLPLTLSCTYENVLCGARVVWSTFIHMKFLACNLHAMASPQF